LDFYIKQVGKSHEFSTTTTITATVKSHPVLLTNATTTGHGGGKAAVTMTAVLMMIKMVAAVVFDGGFTLYPLLMVIAGVRRKETTWESRNDSCPICRSFQKRAL
jgi:hypothetical protein